MFIVYIKIKVEVVEMELFRVIFIEMKVFIIFVKHNNKDEVNKIREREKNKIVVKKHIEDKEKN